VGKDDVVMMRNNDEHPCESWCHCRCGNHDCGCGCTGEAVIDPNEYKGDPGALTLLPMPEGWEGTERDGWNDVHAPGGWGSTWK
jgi:hypothetical protein